jgi:hypothetical protein
MAKVVSTLFISADGVAEIDPDWHFPYFDENMGRAVGEDYDTADGRSRWRRSWESATSPDCRYGRSRRADVLRAGNRLTCPGKVICAGERWWRARRAACRSALHDCRFLPMRCDGAVVRR